MVQVVGLGARCELVPPERYSASPGGVSFDVSEFAVLDDGRRITLHAERGWTTWAHDTERGQIDPWETLTTRGITQDVLNVVLPDEDDGEPHPWEWLRGLLQKHGVEATVEQLKAVPYEVELGDETRARLRA